MNADKFLKKISIILFFILAFAGKLCAFELFQFSVAPKYGLEYGQMNEFLMYKNGNERSELNWEINTINLLGFDTSIGWEMILVKVDCMWGFPKSSGNLYDSDWLNTSNYRMKTNYSENENSVDYLGNLGVKLSINLKIFDFWRILPYLSISYNRIKFSAENGYGWYGDTSKTTDSQYHYWYDSESKKYSTGELCPIDYDRETFNYVIGIETSFTFFSRYILSLDFGLAIFTQVNSIDNHYSDFDKSSYTAYLDKMQGYFKSFSLGTDIDIKIWNGLSAGIGFNFIFINQILGNTYEKSSSLTTYQKNSNYNSAASGYYYNLETFVRYSF